MEPSTSSKSAATYGELLAGFEKYRAENPRGYLRNAAAALATSEAQLTGMQNESSLLVENCMKLIPQVLQLGNILAVVRNNSTVSEASGEVEILRLANDMIMLSVGPCTIELDPRHIEYSFWVQNEKRPSLQLYDSAGDSVLKLFVLNPEPGLPAFANGGQDAAGKLFRTKAVTVDPFKGAANKTPLTDTVARTAIVWTANQGHQIRIIVRNAGSRSIFDGSIANVKDARGWFNILDPDYNLHLKEELIQASYLTEGDGLEIVDDDGFIMSLTPHSHFRSLINSEVT